VESVPVHTDQSMYRNDCEKKDIEVWILVEHGFELMISCMLVWEETVYQPSFPPTSYPHHHKAFADAPSHDTLTASVACYSLITYRDLFS
jgi:hypothetical protein